MTLKKYVDQGFARMLGVLSDERVPHYPNLPTIYEVDVAPKTKKYLATAVTTRSTMRLLIGPPGIPKDRAEFLRNAIWKVLQDKQVHKEFEKRGSIIYRAGNAKEILARIDKVLALSEKDKKEACRLGEPGSAPSRPLVDLARSPQACRLAFLSLFLLR